MPIIRDIMVSCSYTIGEHRNRCFFWGKWGHSGSGAGQCPSHTSPAREEKAAWRSFRILPLLVLLGSKASAGKLEFSSVRTREKKRAHSSCHHRTQLIHPPECMGTWIFQRDHNQGSGEWALWWEITLKVVLLAMPTLQVQPTTPASRWQLGSERCSAGRGSL